jgi:hypothetical protein
MSIRVTLEDEGTESASPLPLECRPKIRVRLNGGCGNGNAPVAPLQLPPAAPEAPEPLPPKVMAFWNFDEDAHRARTPWRYAESPAEQSMREQMERGGAWTG